MSSAATALWAKFTAFVGLVLILIERFGLAPPQDDGALFWLGMLLISVGVIAVPAPIEAEEIERP